MLPNYSSCVTFYNVNYTPIEIEFPKCRATRSQLAAEIYKFQENFNFLNLKISKLTLFQDRKTLNLGRDTNCINNYRLKTIKKYIYIYSFRRSEILPRFIHVSFAKSGRVERESEKDK